MDKLDFVLLEYKDDTRNEYISLCVTRDYIFDSSKSFAILINDVCNNIYIEKINHNKLHGYHFVRRKM